MEKLIIEMEKYRRENLSMNDKELKDLQTLSNEINIVLKHSSEKITLDKTTFSNYFSLFNQYKEIEGFNQAVDYIVAYSKEENH